MNEFYRTRTLPHWHPSSTTLFITFRLAESLPTSFLSELHNQKDTALAEVEHIIEVLKREKQRIKVLKDYNTRIQEALDKVINGPVWLKNEEVAKIVKDKLHELDGKYYELYAYCVMSNHVHLLLRLLEDSAGNQYTLGEVMRLIKGSTARACNKVLNIEAGHSFWAKDYYDTWLRNEKRFDACVWYILKNPVKAGICEDWKEYPHSYANW